jgi:hypothetical protein
MAQVTKAGVSFAARVIEATSGRSACPRRGDCDAVVLGQPQDLIAMEQGYRLLGASTEVVPELRAAGVQ